MNISEYLETKIVGKYQIVEWGYTEDPNPIHFESYLQWINEKKNRPLIYLEGDRKTKRESLKNYYEEFQSALVFLFSYHDMKMFLGEQYSKKNEYSHKIASYTLGFEGIDYHLFIKEKLQLILEELLIYNPELEGRLSIDIHPVLERDLALRAGLGWQGKNSMLITRHSGSFFIIGSLLLNKKLNITRPRKVETDHCGQCTRCIDACPTNAIDSDNRTISAKDCISTFTIEEFKLDTIPSDKMNLSSGYFFGCDICQNVCPWNLRLERNLKNENIKILNEKQVKLIDFFINRSMTMIKEELELMSNGIFLKFFKNTSFERSGKRGILKNVLFYLKNN